MSLLDKFKSTTKIVPKTLEYQIVKKDGEYFIAIDIKTPSGKRYLTALPENTAYNVINVLSELCEDIEKQKESVKNEQFK